jgi:kinesin family protein 1
MCRLLSPEPQRPKSLILENLPQLLGRHSPGSTPLAPSPPSPAFNLIPELEEIRVSPCIAKKGYLNVLEEKSKTWKRRYIILYILFYDDDLPLNLVGISLK